MPDIEHKDITDPQLHEPKGASTAPLGSMYVADGLGSGSWIFPDPKGFDTALNGQVLHKEAGIVAWKYHAGVVHTQIDILTNTNVQTITYDSAITRANWLNADTSYVKASGVAFPWVQSVSSLVSFDATNDDIVIDVAGDYKLDFWASVLCSEATTYVALKYAINNSTPYSVQKLVTQSATADDVVPLSAAGIIENLAVGDRISLYVTAWRSVGTSTNITLEDGGMTLQLLNET